MSFISGFRVFVLSLCFVFGLAILGLTIRLTVLTTDPNLVDPTFFDFEGLGLATGALSTLALPTMLILGATRERTFAAMIVTELCVLGLIWILWLSNAAVLVQWSMFIYPEGCGDLLPFSATICHEFFAIEGLSFTSWLLLMIYSGILLVLALKSPTPIWTVAVNRATFSAPPKETTPEVVTQPLSANNIGSVNSPYNVPVQGSQQFQYPPQTMGVTVQQAPYGPVAAGQPQHPPYPQI